MLDLTRLRILRELARRGTMTAVGEALGMTSSAVSQQLAVLARDVRAPITERTGRRVRLTPEGERLAAHAETILQAVEAAALELSAIGDTLAGALRVATFTTYGRAKLLPAVVRLRDRYPDLDIVIQELEPMESLEAVRDGRCDLAVSFEYNLVPRPVLPGLLVQPLMEEPILVALPERWRTAADPIDLQQLDGQDWIVGSQQADDRQLVERVCAVAGFAPRVTHA
ncbi:MAG TPA: LysR substrate-binding domain-containing protein, partial [Allosphingosinicella sp.]|nr:LysR substrate-binding domain-containing protein [Allosphingosinicella sp.]